VLFLPIHVALALMVPARSGSSARAP
jgi:hypothetical protein